MAPTPLAVVLSAPAASVAVGASLRIGVEVRNVSAEPVWCPGVLDGSEAGLRFPHYLPRIAGPATPQPPALLCGMMAPLREEDFRLLQPGERFDPTDPSRGGGYLPIAAFLGFTPAAPGRYELTLALSTRSGADEEWLGTWPHPAREEVLRRLSRVPRVDVDSNVLVIEAR